MAQIRHDTPPSHTKEDRSKGSITRKTGTETWNKKTKYTERHMREESYRHRQKHEYGFSFGWVVWRGGECEGGTKKQSALETVTMLFPASRSLAVPLSARGPTLHFSNAQTTQFWHLYSAQCAAHNQPALTTNIHNKTKDYRLANLSLLPHLMWFSISCIPSIIKTSEMQ